MAWCYQFFKEAKQKISVEYDDCYFNCPKGDGWDETRKANCDECPHRKVSEKFFTDSQACFEQRFKEGLSKSRFNELLKTVKNVAAYEGTTENIGVKHSHLLTAYLSEKDKYERATRPKT